MKYYKIIITGLLLILINDVIKAQTADQNYIFQHAFVEESTKESGEKDTQNSVEDKIKRMLG